MKKQYNFKTNLIILVSIITFITFFFLYLTLFSITKQEDQISIVLFIGFALFIGCIFYFFLYLDLNMNKNYSFDLRIVNENGLFFIILILMVIFYFVPAISYSELVIAWQEIPLLNLIRAIISVVGGIFLPGYCIFNIIFPQSSLSDRFSIEPFFIKIVAYPLISLPILGTFSLLTDYIGIAREFMPISLAFILIALFIINVFFQKRREKKIIAIEKKTVNISKYSLFVIIVLITTLIITIGIRIDSSYLINIDSYRALKHYPYIGTNEGLSAFNYEGSYTIIWTYIAFSLSCFSGIPVINTITLLFPFNYLFVLSIYLLMKAFLKNMKEVYAILATLMAISFSALFDFFYIYNLNERVSLFIFEGTFNFRYKSVGINLFIFSMALFLVLIKTAKKGDFEFNAKNEGFLLVTLSSFLLLQSYIIYYFPLLAAALLILPLMVLNRRNKLIFKIYVIFLALCVIFFIAYDLLTYHLISKFQISHLSYFISYDFSIEGLPNEYSLIIQARIIYLILILFLVLNYCFYKMFHRKDKLINETRRKNSLNEDMKFIFLLLLLVLSMFLFLHIILNLIYTIRSLSYFTFILYLFFLNIGYLGIFGLYFSYYFYKKNKQLFLIVIIWFFLLFGTSLLVLILYFFRDPSSNPFMLAGDIRINYWFSRVWYYSIIPLSILASYNLLKLIKVLSNKYRKKRFKKRNIIALKTSFISVFIVLTLSNTIIGAIGHYNDQVRLNHNDAQILGWAYENIPQNSNILAYRNLYLFMDDILKVKTYKVVDEIENALNEYPPWNIMKSSYDNCSIEYLEFFHPQQRVISFNDKNDAGRNLLSINYDEPREYGTIEFSITSDNFTKEFWINFSSSEGIIGTSLVLKMGGLYYFNGSEYNKILDLLEQQWYNMKFDFECGNSNFLGLNKYNWSISVNETNYGIYSFWHNIEDLDYVIFESSLTHFDWNVYISDIKFSWVPDFKIENSIFNSLIILDYLKAENINYLILPMKIYDYTDQIEGYFSLIEEMIDILESKKVYSYEKIAVYKI